MAETGPHDQPDEALVDLLVKQVTEGLSQAEERALDVLDSADAAMQLRAFEHAAAAVTLAALAAPEALPAALRARLEREANTLTAPALTAPAVSPGVVAFDRAKGAPQATVGRPASGSSLGWLAAAACLVLAVFGWLRHPPEVAAPVAEVHVEPPPVQVAPPPAEPTPSAARAALLARADSVKITLGATKDPAAQGVTADVVWDPVTHTGFAHFAGLKSNDPHVLQYQLWIFDATRDKRYPVDGGVFDVPADSPDVVIPIRATLPIRQVAAFAVTVEKPGGVVVSDLSHVVALGKTG
jgi:hypothetical protein